MKINAQTHINLEFLEGRGDVEDGWGTLDPACSSARKWFCATFPDGATVEAVVAQAPFLDWVVWLAFNAAATTGEIEELLNAMFEMHKDGDQTPLRQAKQFFAFRNQTFLVGPGREARVARWSLTALAQIVRNYPNDASFCRDWAARMLACDPATITSGLEE